MTDPQEKKEEQLDTREFANTNKSNGYSAPTSSYINAEGETEEGLITREEFHSALRKAARQVEEPAVGE